MEKYLDKQDVRFGKYEELISISRKVKNNNAGLIYCILKESMDDNNIWVGRAIDLAKELGFAPSTMAKFFNILIDNRLIKSDMVRMVDKDGKKGWGLRIKIK
jgi:hypothetical protein